MLHLQPHKILTIITIIIDMRCHRCLLLLASVIVIAIICIQSGRRRRRGRPPRWRRGYPPLRLSADVAREPLTELPHWAILHRIGGARVAIGAAATCSVH